MKNLGQMFRLLSDQTRLRMLLLLDKKELCVCQIMGILGISQPLVSRNLSLLSRGGFLEDRREGKLMYYRTTRQLDDAHKKIYDYIKEMLRNDETVFTDLNTLIDCTEFQKQEGRCDMETFNKFLEKRKKSVRRGPL
jgi:DNA-binding transcriptional ArsR family regulator